MERRKFIGRVAGAFIVAATLARGQQKDVVRRIGLLDMVEETAAESLLLWGPRGYAHELGWIEGQNLIVERRYARSPEQLQSLAKELVRIKVDLILASGTDATLAAKNATNTIPIVSGGAGDPVLTGLVTSLARPGGNITGIASVTQEVDAKRLSLLRELLPRARLIGDLENPTNPIWRATRDEYERVYRSLDMQPIFISVSAPSELQNAVAEAGRRGAQALVVRGDGMLTASRVAIMEAALRHMLPAIGGHIFMLDAGSLFNYAIELSDIYRRVVAFVDKILRGAKPADLPMEQPTKFELGINLRTAKALGVAIPRDLLLRADRIIQ
jgi:putative ABC transport system substrate-binding protein